MKRKVFSLGAIILISLSINSANIQSEQVNCLDIWTGTYDLWIEFGHDTAWQVANWQYEACVTYGGDPGGDSVVILTND